MTTPYADIATEASLLDGPARRPPWPTAQELRAAGLEDEAAAFSAGVPPRPGLVPQSGDPMHPRHWVRPAEAAPPAAEAAPPAAPAASGFYDPDPAARNAATGLADRARVGVPAMEVPPPPGIGRLPNLGKKARAVEDHYARAFQADPDGMAKKYLKALRKRKVGEYPNVFATDDVKALNPDWNPDGPSGPGAKLTKEAKAAMAKYNAAVHQTANAIAKRAFLAYLDGVVAHLPPERRTVLVTNGGCAAGKGSSLARSGQEGSSHQGMLPAPQLVGAIWDAAGEQNATENEWVLQECRKRGLKAVFAYVWAEPRDTWDGEGRGVIRRAMRKGRMVDARLFADSYAVGARNMKDFHEKHKDDGDAAFIFIDNRDKASPKLLDAFPDATLKWDADAIYRDALSALERRKGDLSKELYNAGKAGTRIWGPPQPV